MIGKTVPWSARIDPVTNGGVHFLEKRAAWARRAPAPSQLCRRSHQLSGDKCNNIWVLVGEDSHAGLSRGGFCTGCSLGGLCFPGGALRRPEEINFGGSCVGNLNASISSLWLVPLRNLRLIGHRQHMNQRISQRSAEAGSSLKETIFITCKTARCPLEHSLSAWFHPWNLLRPSKHLVSPSTKCPDWGRLGVTLNSFRSR